MKIDYNKENENITELIKSELIKNNLLDFIIQNRVKSLKSIEKKSKKKDSFGNQKEITDYSGVRIIVNRLSQIRKCIEIMTEKFQIDYSNSNFNPHSFIEDKEFGYRSSHIVLINNNIKSEIQIRTFAQHIWANTSHSLDYKSNVKDTIFPRKLFRLSGLLEQIDIINEDLYETSPNENKSSLESLGELDHYSLEYYLSRKEKLFTLICLGFEEKKESKFGGTMKWSFSMKILDGGKVLDNNNKDDIDLILLVCKQLKLKTINSLKIFIEENSKYIKNITKAYHKSKLPWRFTPNTFRLFFFLFVFISENEIDKLLEERVHSEFLINLKQFHKIYNK